MAGAAGRLCSVLLLCCVSVRGGVIGWWARVVVSVEKRLLGNTKTVVTEGVQGQEDAESLI
jgi:hypothetical protein